MKNELWVFELSESQGCFHVDTLTRSLETNRYQAERFFRGTMQKGAIHDFRPLFIGTSEEVCKFSENFREYIEQINPRHAKFGTLESMYDECMIDEQRGKALTN